jgi:uncharacterized protein YacL
LLHWCCFGYSYCYFCTVLCNRYFTAVIHLHIILSFLQDKRVFFTLISYICFLIRVCFTLCCNVKVIFFHVTKNSTKITIRISKTTPMQQKVYKDGKYKKKSNSSILDTP